MSARFHRIASHRVNSGHGTARQDANARQDKLGTQRVIAGGGIPEEGINEGGVLAARVPVYGTVDAGRSWWLQLKDVVEENGYVLNRILPTMFTLREGEKF